MLGTPSRPATPLPPSAIRLEIAAPVARVEAPSVASGAPKIDPVYADTEAPPLTKAEANDRTTSARELLDFLEEALKAPSKAERRARLYYEQARLWLVPLDEPTKAIPLLKKTLELAPDHAGAVATLRQALLLAREYEAALPWFDREVELTGASAAKAALLYAKGGILETALGRPSDARSAFEAALALEPQDAATLRAVHRLRSREKAWKEVDKLLERRAERARELPSLHAARLGERARLVETKTKNPALAAALYDLALAAAPESPLATLDVERLHHLLDHPKELGETLERRSVLAGDPEVQFAALVRAADVHENQLGDRRGASRLLERALEIAPRDRALLERVARLSEAEGDGRAQLSALSRLEALATNDASRADLRQRIGDVFEGTLDDPARAIEAFESARALAPAHPGATAALLRHYELRGNAEARIAVLRGIAEHAPQVERRLAAELECARVFETALGDRETALAHYRRALVLVPDHEGAFQSLGRLLSELGRKRELVELYERAIESAPDDATFVSHLLSVGRILETDLGDPARAVEAYLRLLARVPDHLAGLYSLARAAEHAGRHDVWVEALTRQAKAFDGTRKLRVLHRSAEVLENFLRDDEKAIETHRALLKQDPKFSPSLASLARIFERLGRIDELVEIVGRMLLLAEDASERAELHFRLAELHEYRLGKADAAIAEYKKALKDAPEHERAREGLGRLLRRSGLPEELVAHLQRETELTKDSRRKAEVLAALAELQEYALRKPADALRSYEALHALTKSRRAFEGRIRLHTLLGQSKELAALLDEEAELAADPFTRLGARLRAAEVYRDELGQSEVAAARYEAVLAERPGNPDALVALELLYAELGRSEDLARILQVEVEKLELREERLAALREMSRLALPARPALETTKALLALAPNDPLGLETLALSAAEAKNLSLLAQADGRLAELDAAPLVKAAHYTRLGEHVEAKNGVQALMAYRAALALDKDAIAAARGVSRVALLAKDPALLEEAAEGELSTVGDRIRAASLLTTAAELLESQSEFERASALLERVLLIEPNELRAAGRLFSLRGREKNWDRLLTVLSDAATRATDPNASAEHWIAVARVHATEKEDLPAAFAALQRVEKAQPKNLRVLLELGELYYRTHQYPQAAARFESAELASPDPKQLTHLRLRLAELHHAHLGKPEEAMRRLALVLEANPGHKEALRRLLALQIERGLPEAATTARMWAESSSGSERAEALTIWGRLARDRRDFADADRAFTEAVRLVGMATEGPGADWLELLRSEPEARKVGGYESFARALEEFSGTSKDGRASATASIALGRIFMDELGAPERGIPALERGLARSPDDVELRSEFVLRLETAGQLDKALAEGRRVLGLAPTHADAWKTILRLLEKTGRNAESVLALGPLVLLGGESELQRAQWRGRRPRPGWIPPSSLAGARLETTSSPLDAETRNLLEQLSSLAHKVLGSWERLGLEPKEKISLRSQHPLKPILERAKNAFADVEVDFFFAPEDQGAVRFVLGDPTGVLLPGNFAGLHEADQIFLVTEKLAMIARGTALAGALSPAEFADFLVAAARLVAPGFCPERTTPEIDALSKRIQKNVAWLAKGRFEDALRRYVEKHPNALPDPKECVLAAQRLALVVADDISPIALITRPEKNLLGVAAGEEPAFQKHLLGAWLSESSSRLREELGLG